MKRTTKRKNLPGIDGSDDDLQRRVQATPVPLDSEESGAMCEWALIVQSHYAEIVELFLTGPAPEARGNMFYYRLHEAAVR